MKTRLIYSCLAIGMLAAGCSGKDGNDPAPIAPPPQQSTGVFVDSIVTGLNFSNGAASGITDDFGQYRYRADLPLCWSVGAIALGCGAGLPVMTPVNLVEGADASLTVERNPPAVTNIAMFLMSLDDDDFAANGIRIAAAIRAAAANAAAIDFTRPTSEFASPQGAAASFVASVGKTLISASVAQTELQASLNDLAANGGRANVLPIANAGPDQTVAEGAAVQLAGSGADDDGQVMAFRWIQTGGPPVTLADAISATPGFTAPQVNQTTQLHFGLTVVDNRLGHSWKTDAITVTVNDIPGGGNSAPTADAGADQAVNEGALVTLAGSGADSDDGSIASYRWEQVRTESDPVLQLNNASSATASFTAPQVNATTPLRLRLTVTDNQGATASDEQIVTVRDVPGGNQAPVAEAGVDQMVVEGAPVVLTGRGADSDGTISAFAWEQVSGPAVTLSSSNTAVTGFAAPEVDANAQVVLRLTVTDNASASGSDEVTVFVTNRTLPPVAACAPGALCAGAAKARITPSSAHIAGVQENRLGGQKAMQKFHLGGFGFGPFEAFGPLNDAISNDPASRAYHCTTATADCAEDQREHTWVRAFYLSQPAATGAATEILLVNIDAVGAGNLIQQDLKAAIAAATNVPLTNILVGQTHSHAGADLQGLWGGVPQDWVRNVLYKEAAAAAKQAKDTSARATLTYATGQDGAWNSYRRPRYNRDATADETLSVLQAQDSAGTVLGTVVQYAAHPTAIGTGSGGALGRAVHADYPLGIEDTVETATGATALYFNGPIADASGSGPTQGSDDYRRVHSRGVCVARSALKLLDAAAPAQCAGSELNLGNARRVTLAPSLTVAHKTATLPITNPAFVALGLAGGFNRYYDFAQLPLAQIPGIGAQLAAEQGNLPQLTPTATTQVSRLTIGAPGEGLEIVTIPGEATNTYGQYIRGLAATPNMMLLGLTQNSFGYILPEEEFNFINPDGDAGFVLPFTGYEEFVSMGPLTAPLLRLQAYNPLFGVAQNDPRNLPPFVSACENPSSPVCAINNLGQRVDYIQRAYQQQCRDNLVVNAPKEAKEAAEQFCGLINPNTPLEQPCRDQNGAPAVCDVLGGTNNAATGRVRAGVGVADMTPDVGYCSGQYCDETDLPDGLGGGDIDPYATAKTKKRSYGVQSRLTARAIVVEGANGKRVALVKTDNYLAQDTLIRRVAQILQDRGSQIRHEQILHHVTHNHSSAYSSTPSWGVWVFQDVFDARFFENQARKIADAIAQAESNLKPARMGATTVKHRVFKGNVVRQEVATDGTPAGYPIEYGDHGLVVMRFDDMTNPAAPKPLAVWMNWGEHPESLDGYDMHSADFLASLERYIDRDLGAPLVFSQGDVGSAENSGNKCEVLDDFGQPIAVPGLISGFEANGIPICNNNALNAAQRDKGVWRDWNHAGFVQVERNARFLADAVIEGWMRIGSGEAQVPFAQDFVVDSRKYFAPGPLSHPYPSVSNCRTEATAQGDAGVPLAGLPDCGRFGLPGKNPITDQAALAYATMKAEGIPLPDHYDASAYTGVEENLRMYLQAFRLGEVLLASCACEAQADLILNLESRADKIAGNIYDGFDFACLSPAHASDPKYANACAVQRTHYNPADYSAVGPLRPGAFDNAANIARMRAQIHNDARGWDAPENALTANSEPPEIASIWGNFTKEELAPARGYTLPVGIGHAGDYNGYTVSYREYMNRDSYRKALTAYGPHTADYMVSRLVRMAGAMKGAPELVPEPHDALSQADEARMVAQSQAIGRASSAAYDGVLAALAPDKPAQITQPPVAVQRFTAATMQWRGGSTAIDNPIVRVQRRNAQGTFIDAFDMSGEVQTRVKWPQGVQGVVQALTGQHDWLWTANFETYSAFPARLGGTLEGTYRFVAQGRSKTAGGTQAYELTSAPFTVSPWQGVPVTGASRSGASVSFSVPAFTYPVSYTSAFPYVQVATDNVRFCEQCSFRPWARVGLFDRAEVRVGGAVIAATCDSASPRSCSANLGSHTGPVEVRAYDAFGNFGVVTLP